MIFGGFVEKQERKVVAGQLEELASDLRAGKARQMSETAKHYLEGLGWAAVSGMIPVLETALTSGQFSKGTWTAAASAALLGIAAYLRKNSFSAPASDAPKQ